MRAWELQAKGIIDAAEEEAVKIEAELAARLRAVLSEPAFAAFFSVLGTPSYHGEVHNQQGVSAADAPAPAVVESNAQPAPALTPVQVDPAAIEKLLASLTPEQQAALAAMGQAVVAQGVVPVPTQQEAATQQ